MDQLINHLNNQIEQLNLITSEIGLPDDSKQERVQHFLKAIEQFASDQCALLEKEKENIIKETESTYRSILSYKQLMGEYVPNTLAFDSDTPLKNKLQNLQQEFTQVKEEYNNKLGYVQELHKQLEALSYALGGFVNTNLIATTEIDVSSLAVNSLEDELQRTEQEYVSRKAVVDHSVDEICFTIDTLGLNTTHELDILSKKYKSEVNPDNKMELCNLLVSEDSMDSIANRVAELREIRGRVESHKEELKNNLHRIWDILRVDPDECEAFIMSNEGLNPEKIQNYEQELEKLLVLKQERIGEFIERAREELQILWEQLYYSETQRHQFLSAYSEELDDKILMVYEEEISRLRLELEDSKYIIERIQKYMQLKKEIEEFQDSTKDPNRLFGKGQRDPGRLLREEKFRKRMDRELPKLRMELEGSLLEYEALKSRPFMVYGKPYLDVIYEANEEAAQQKVPITAPRTPKRETVPRKPFTSPRNTSNRYHMFNTPQFNRTRHFQVTAENMTPTKEDRSITVLHRVRERNIRKRSQKPIRRGHFGSDDDDDEEEAEAEVERMLRESKNAMIAAEKKQKSIIKQKHMENEFESDDNFGVNLDIFDDGPDLSDMSDIDS